MNADANPKRTDGSTKWSLAGAVAAAVGATMCCKGPLPLIALGIGGDGGEGRRFPGSPSVFVDGMDIGPGRQDDPSFFGCRTYFVEGKKVGGPPESWLVHALRKQKRRDRSRVLE